MNPSRHAVIVLLILLALCTFGQTVAGADLIEPHPGATINWTRGTAQARGANLAPIADRNEALAQARLAAQKNLIDALMAIRVDADRRAGDMVSQNKVLKTRLDQIVRQSAVVAEQVFTGGLAEIMVEVPLTGAVSQLLLPDGIRQLDSIKTVGAPVRGQDNGKQVFNRLVVDARGLDIKPALSPRILDETGRQVYGPAFISRDFAVERGVSGYVRYHPQVAQPLGTEDKALMVKALRMQGAGATDLVISMADAARLHSASEHLTFLKQCRVVIVTD